MREGSGRGDGAARGSGRDAVHAVGRAGGCRGRGGCSFHGLLGAPRGVPGFLKRDPRPGHAAVRVQVDLGDSGLTYLPGDALGVWPYNEPQVGTGALGF